MLGDTRHDALYDPKPHLDAWTGMSWDTESVSAYREYILQSDDVRYAAREIRRSMDGGYAPTYNQVTNLASATTAAMQHGYEQALQQRIQQQSSQLTATAMTTSTMFPGAAEPTGRQEAGSSTVWHQPGQGHGPGGGGLKRG